MMYGYRKKLLERGQRKSNLAELIAKQTKFMAQQMLTNLSVSHTKIAAPINITLMLRRSCCNKCMHIAHTDV